MIASAAELAGMLVGELELGGWCTRSAAIAGVAELAGIELGGWSPGRRRSPAAGHDAAAIAHAAGPMLVEVALEAGLIPEPGRGSPWRPCCRRPMPVEITLSELVARGKLAEVALEAGLMREARPRAGAAAIADRAAAGRVLVEVALEMVAASSWSRSPYGQLGAGPDATAIALGAGRSAGRSLPEVNIAGAPIAAAHAAADELRVPGPGCRRAAAPSLP